MEVKLIVAWDGRGWVVESNLPIHPDDELEKKKFEIILKEQDG